jgi:acetylornithine deacetylase/succinyl-diaminopimelate desuccinylase-like protein
MKAGVAINIALIDFMLRNKIKFRVLCYADEEYHFRGMKKFVETYQGKIHPKLTIVTEPTNAKIYT